MQLPKQRWSGLNNYHLAHKKQLIKLTTLNQHHFGYGRSI